MDDEKHEEELKIAYHIEKDEEKEVQVEEHMVEEGHQAEKEDGLWRGT